VSAPTAGEAWSRAALADLRAGRHRPRAWARFLRLSCRRSLEDARRRPDLTGPALAWCAAGAVLWAALATLDPQALWALAWWAAVAAMLLAHLGMVEGPAGERRAGLGAANGLTLARAWLVPALPLLAGRPAAFVAVFAAGIASDALDGPLARRRGEVTRLGERTDAAVDLAFMLAAAWAAVASGWLPAWVVALVAARALVPPLLIALVYFARASAPARAAIVRGRHAGAVLAAGLALAAVEQARTAALALVAAGLAGGALAVAASSWRVARGRIPR